MHEPELLILDEPTSGLDPIIQQRFLELVAEARSAGQTVFMSSHVLSEVQQSADRVGIIRDGKLVAVEAVESLRRRAVRRVEIQFDEPVPRRGLQQPAGPAQDVEVDGTTLRCRLAGRADGAGQGGRPVRRRRPDGRGAGPRGAVLHVLPRRGGGRCCVASSARRCGISGARSSAGRSGSPPSASFYAAFYPSINSPEYLDMLESFPPGVLDAMGFADIAHGSRVSRLDDVRPARPGADHRHGRGARRLGDRRRRGVRSAGPHACPSGLAMGRVVQRFAALVVAMVVVCAVLTVALAGHLRAGPARRDRRRESGRRRAAPRAPG